MVSELWGPAALVSHQGWLEKLHVGVMVGGIGFAAQPRTPSQDGWAGEITRDGSLVPMVDFIGGRYRTRTYDPGRVKAVLYQLS